MRDWNSDLATWEMAQRNPRRQMTEGPTTPWTFTFALRKLLLSGRYYGQCPEIDGQIIINDFTKVDAFGKYYTVEITDVAGYDYIGRVV